MEGIAETMFVTYCGNNCLEGVTFLCPGLPAEIENCAEMEGIAETMFVTYCGNNCLEGVTFLCPGLLTEIENSPILNM